MEAGINVWTTVNVQHLESLNDLITQITGVQQRETLPDHVFDEADELELIDLPPDDLLARLHAGKVYIQDDVASAVERFFRKPNLLALRELALRRVADRVEAAARASLAPGESSRTRFANDRILVAIGPDAQAEQLVRAGKRIADALDAQWIVVYVETPALLRLSETERNRRIDVLRLAESLGAETVTLDGPSAATTLVEYAQTRHATRLIVGSPKRRGWRAWLRPSTSTELLRRARDFDVIAIAPAQRAVAEATRTSRMHATADAQPIQWKRYIWALTSSVVCTAAAFLMYPRFELSNLVMVYLLGVTVAGLRLGRGPAALTAVLNVAAFDFFFVPPRFTFAVSDAQYLVTFAVMLIIALVIANLMASVRQQTRVAGARERRTALLYGMSRELAVTRGVGSMARVAVKHYPHEAPLEASLRGADLAIAQWVVDHARRAGLGTDTLAAAPALYVPLGDTRPALGVVAVLPSNRRRVLLPEQRHLLETFAGQIALALERARLAESAESARIAAESESLRNTLLASISHDLRTPLAVIAGAGSTLAQHGATLDPETRTALARSIVLRRDWQTLDDLIGAALQKLETALSEHPFDLRVPFDLPPVYVDATLIVQVFFNLFDNAAKYTPAGTPVSVSAVSEGSIVRVTLDDEGPGLPAGDPARLFDKFQRGGEEGTIVGVGLGLAISRAILRAHGTDIEAQRRPGGGARFEFTLPATGEGT